VPAVGYTVRVEYQDKHPDKVELVLNGDDRYDMALSNREEREREKAGQASRDAAFQAALDAPPGTPSASGPPPADGADTQDFPAGNTRTG
jgi:hypothetical protein